MQRPADDRHEAFKRTIGVAKNPGQIGILGLGTAAQGRLGRCQPSTPFPKSHPTALGFERRQDGRGFAGKGTRAQSAG